MALSSIDGKMGSKCSKGKVTVVLDAQAGSCGKGKMVGYLALRDKPAVAINNFMTNAGHTFIDDDGRHIMTQHLPTSMVNKSTVLCIGPGAAITLDTLVKEIGNFRDIIGDRKVYIHPRAMIILPKHMEKEKELVRSGSTFKGCGVAQADKIMRVPGTVLMGSNEGKTLLTDSIIRCYPLPYPDNGCDEANVGPEDFQDYIWNTIEIADTSLIVNEAIDNGQNVMVEGSQGCDLDINYGLDYPHCTSRQCHAGQLVADCGISPRLVTGVIMIMRPYPIRISNQTNIGLNISSGDYCGSKELTWDDIRHRCGAPEDIEFGEMTTVTKKKRRVFEMNWDRLKYTAMINRPTAIALNFAQYLNWDVSECKYLTEIPDEVFDFMYKVEYLTGVPVKFVGTGAKNSDIIDIDKR